MTSGVCINYGGQSRNRTLQAKAMVLQTFWLPRARIALIVAGVTLAPAALRRPYKVWPIGCAGRNRTVNTRAYETRQPTKACPRVKLYVCDDDGDEVYLPS